MTDIVCTIKKAFNNLMEYDYKTALAKGDETKGQM